MTQKTLGVVGGLGIETSLKFCANVAARVRGIARKQPSIFCHIVNMPAKLETDLVYGRTSAEHLSMLIGSIKLLEMAGAKRIVVPCNTVHVFLDQMRENTAVPVFSIIEETADRINSMGIKKAGIMASSATTNTGLYSKELSKYGIKTIMPKCADQKIISSLIIKILNGAVTQADEEDANTAVERLEEAGAEAIILGCTDLRLIKFHSKKPIIDSTAVLEDVSVEYLAYGEVS